MKRAYSQTQRLVKVIFRIFLITLLGGLPIVCEAQEKSPEAKLFKEYKENKTGSILPDFSYAGYHHGEKSIPSPDLKIFDVTKFGAIPNDNISDKEAIRKAICAAGKNGGGIVLFPKGKFLINEDNDSPDCIIIKSDKIIIRGSGSGNDNTELFMKNPLKPIDTTKMWTSPPMFILAGTHVLPMYLSLIHI
eukprot:TRINITY_DN1741_c0_g1_i2.p1 TRINITY_DN1741_c0_g1~~TRINITY_DN1741_c0_g1_i2.p1  ORF type:complete len:191 (-),score=19.94 TRINITY_DN1741_c0_g1_i2:3-575(-)